MKVCIVGTCTFGNFGKRIFVPKRQMLKEKMGCLITNISLLESFFFLSESKDFPYMKKLSEDKLDLFLDSGAFSAYSKGVDISIENYADFIKENESILSAYANLDVIGDPEATWKNQRKMEKLGLSPVPTFHYGENPKWLKRYLRRGHDYIALGGMVPISTKNLIEWLDHIWKRYLVDIEGMPIVKVHGFGMTVFKLMFRYPWYSIDSTTWVIQAAMGNVYVPMVRRGEYDYKVPPRSILITNRAREDKAYISNLSPIIKQSALEYIKEKDFSLGISRFRKRPEGYKIKSFERWTVKPEGGTGEVETIIKEGLTNSDIHRKLFNCMYFYDLQKNFKKWPWALEKKKIKTYGMFR